MTHWFKKHPRFLQKESTALSNDSNYQELYQSRQKLFLSHGNIVVRSDNTLFFPILILYTDATPYQPPLIFPLKRQMSEAAIRELSALSLQEVLERIKPVIQFYHDLRHQNNSGQLCIVEQDSLDNGSNFVSISSLLQRVRDWYAGHITGYFPPDSEEVEFHAHFNNVSSNQRLLYPEEFLDIRLIEGNCYATIFKIIPKNNIIKIDRYIYWGAFLEGIGSNGLILDSMQNISYKFPTNEIQTPIDIHTKPEVISRLIDQKDLLIAAWFHIEREPAPFQSFSGLISIIGNGHYDEGIKRMSLRMSDYFKQISDYFYLAIRFANRKGLLEFQLFKIYRKEQPPSFVMQQNAVERMKEIAKQYETVELIISEKLSESSYHLRNSNRANRDMLKSSAINFFGVGAIGSELADCMTKAGIGKINLIDNQALQAHNAIRHLAGIEYIGEAKVQAVADILHNHNPYVDININTFNIYEMNFFEHLENGYLNISSVADDNLEGFINQQLVISKKTAFYVRALRGGKAARIFRVIPGKDACFNCLSLYRNSGQTFINIPEDPELPTLKNECNNPVRPASAADLKFISAFASRLLIDHLQDGPSDANHWIWTSENIKNTSLVAYQVHQQHLPIHPNCQYCHHDNKVSVYMSQQATSYMQELIMENNKIETGGVLAGWINDQGNIVVTDASGPGPNAIKTSQKFMKDTVYCQQYLDNLYIASGHKKVYVGEWHSHPSLDNNPSSLDIKSLTDISLQQSYLTDMPVMIIYSNKGEPSATIHPAGKSYYQAEIEIAD